MLYARKAGNLIRQLQLISVVCRSDCNHHGRKQNMTQVYEIYAPYMLHAMKLFNENLEIFH